MKANELMIGDYFRIAQTGKIIKIVAVDEPSGSVDYFDGDAGGVLTIGVEKIEPIPLTKEILEKNGFDIAILNNKEPEAYLRMGYLDDDGEMEDVAYDIIIDHHKTYWELTIINNDKGCRIDININYVHELQHALRLCGITHEISL